MVKTKPATRIALQLDTRIALEAIILNRLQRIPANRRQEWLRGLLVQGFRQECLSLRGMSAGNEKPPAMTFTPRLAGVMKGSVVTSDSVPMVPLPVTGKSDKPFAGLGKVIG
jgi:hypothetical protein